MSGLTRRATRATRPSCARHCRKAVQFARRLCVDRPDVGGNRGLELVARLADAGKDDVFRLEPGALCHLNFTPRIGVNATAERAQEAQQR